MPDEGSDPGRPSRRRDLGIRILTGLLLAGLVLGTLFSSHLAWIGVVTVAVLIAQVELYKAFESAGYGPATGLGVAGGAVLLIGSYFGGEAALGFALAMSVAAAFMWFLADPKRTHAAERIATTLLGILYVPFLGAHVVLMRDLPSGPAVTASYVGIVALYDIGAYAAGSMVGRHPMAPAVSPKKSWEGAAGGTLLIVVIALGAGPFIGPFTVMTAAGLAMITSVAAPIGDLAESLIKRDLSIKDMGSILPGHGGLLDRIDALLFMAPAAYWYLRAAVF